MGAHAPLANAVSGVFDGPPPGVCFPYVTVGESPCVDWSHKSGRGREVRLVLTVWDDGARAARLHGLMREVEAAVERSEEHTSELQSLMRISYAVFCLKKQKT